MKAGLRDRRLGPQDLEGVKTHKTRLPVWRRRSRLTLLLLSSVTWICLTFFARKPEMHVFPLFYSGSLVPKHQALPTSSYSCCLCGNARPNRRSERPVIVLAAASRGDLTWLGSSVRLGGSQESHDAARMRIGNRETKWTITFSRLMCQVNKWIF